MRHSGAGWHGLNVAAKIGLVVGGAVMLLAAASGPAGREARAQAPQKFTIRIAHSSAKGHWTDLASEKFAELIAQRSDGRFAPRVYPGGQLGGERDIAEGVLMGSVEVQPVSTILANWVPKVAILDLPYLYRDMEHIRKVHAGPVGQELKRLLLEKGIRVMGMYHQPPRITLTKRPVKKLEDYKGMKMRAPEIDVYIAAIRGLGATPTIVPWPEVYTSLQTGVAEGVEVDAGAHYTMKFYEIAKYATLTRHITQTIFFNIAEKFYQSLPADLRKVVDTSGAETCDYLNQVTEAKDQEMLEKLKSVGVTVTEIDLTQARLNLAALHEEFGRKLGASDLIKQIKETR